MTEIVLCLHMLQSTKISIKKKQKSEITRFLFDFSCDSSLTDWNTKRQLHHEHEGKNKDNYLNSFDRSITFLGTWSECDAGDFCGDLEENMPKFLNYQFSQLL